MQNWTNKIVKTIVKTAKYTKTVVVDLCQYVFV